MSINENVTNETKISQNISMTMQNAVEVAKIR